MIPITYIIIAIFGSIALFSSVHDQNKAAAEKARVAQVEKLQVPKGGVGHSSEIALDRDEKQ